MPHISSQKLDSKLLEKIFTELFNVFNCAQGKNNLPLVINELFTNTEKIMFAKRLAIILMLSDSIPQRKIAEILKVSPSTVAIISLKIEVQQFKVILEISKKQKIDFEKIVFNILTVGGIMPPKVGRKYWTKHIK